MEENTVNELVRKHEVYKLSGINLIASENWIAESARWALSSDLAGRYDGEWYGGDRYAAEVCAAVEALAREVFSARYAFVTPVSGNMCDLAAIFAFTKAGDDIAGVPPEHGGYPFGYGKFQRGFRPLPMKDYCVDEKRLGEVEREVPLVLLASSVILFPHPVEKMAGHFSGTLAYDASHVLGLIAGGEFQQPLKEGSDILMGSTHKSFPGPQGGIVMTNNRDVADALARYLRFDLEEGIGLVDNPHVHRIACLGMVLEEMREHGARYARQIIKNARTLAEAMHELHVPVMFSERGFTGSHQVMLALSDKEAVALQKRLESHHIFIDRMGRLGVAEVTNLGMGEKEMHHIAHMIADVYHGREIGDAATKLAMKFYL